MELSAESLAEGIASAGTTQDIVSRIDELEALVGGEEGVDHAVINVDEAVSAALNKVLEFKSAAVSEAFIEVHCLL